MQLLVTSLLALTGAAHAEDLTIHDGWLLEPVESTYYENGIGSPTVAYDRAADQWVMFFETRFGDADADCAQGRWGIGRAVSADGLNWTIDPTLLIGPEEDSYYSCVLAHPTVIHDGDTWHLWFKAHQTNTACDTDSADTGSGEPAWGCAAVTGVGYASSTDGRDFTVTDEPILNLSSFGFPTVTRVNGVYRMLLAYANESFRIYELWESVSTDDGDTWSAPERVVEPGFATWAEDEIYNPAVTCRPDDTFPYILWAGGRNVDNGSPPTIQTAGLGLAFSDDGVNWPWDADNPIILWDLDPDPPTEPDKDWRHWDVVRIGEDFLLYFSQKDDMGRNRVGLAYTYDSQQTSFLERRISDRVCVIGSDTGSPDTGDTDTDTDTDTDVDTDTSSVDTDTDTGPERPDKSCRGCSASGGTAGGLLLLPGLLWLRRRR